MSRVQNDTRQIEEFVAIVVFGLADLLSVVAVVAAMIVMSPLLAVVTMTVVPLLLAIITVWQRVARESRVQTRTMEAAVNSHLQETISGIRVVQSMNREQANLRRFKAVADEALASLLRMNRYVSFMWPAATAVSSFGIGFVVVFGGLLVLDDSVGAGVLIAFAIYVDRFFDPLRSLTQGYNGLHGAMAAGSRIFELLDIEPDISDPPNAAAMPTVRGQVRFDRVGFEYQTGVPVLQDVDLTVQPGQTVAIVGPTGAPARPPSSPSSSDSTNPHPAEYSSTGTTSATSSATHSCTRPVSSCRSPSSSRARSGRTSATATMRSPTRM